MSIFITVEGTNMQCLVYPASCCITHSISVQNDGQQWYFLATNHPSCMNSSAVCVRLQRVHVCHHHRFFKYCKGCYCSGRYIPLPKQSIVYHYSLLPVRMVNGGAGVCRPQCLLWRASSFPQSNGPSHVQSPRYAAGSPLIHCFTHPFTAWHMYVSWMHSFFAFNYSFHVLLGM